MPGTYPFHGCHEQVVQSTERRPGERALPPGKRGGPVLDGRRGVADQAGRALAAPGERRTGVTSGTGSVPVPGGGSGEATQQDAPASLPVASPPPPQVLFTAQ